MLNLFVTGTDTDVGKTLISTGLLEAFNRLNKQTIGYKPISAGCEQTEFGLENGDAKALQQYSSVALTLNQVNPIAFAPPIAPHIAAEQVGQTIAASKIMAGWQRLADLQPDVLLTEGAGGWQLPINNQQCLPEVLTELKPQVIIVVGMRLGCLNHSLLTVDAIKQKGFEIAGWVANHLCTDMPVATKNLSTLKAFIDAPLIGEVPYLGDDAQSNAVQRVADCLDVSGLTVI